MPVQVRRKSRIFRVIKGDAGKVRKLLFLIKEKNPYCHFPTLPVRAQQKWKRVIHWVSISPRRKSHCASF